MFSSASIRTSPPSSPISTTKSEKGNYLVFLTADHGASHSIDFMRSHQLPAGFVGIRNLMKQLGDTLSAVFGVNDLLLNSSNYYVNFNLARIRQEKLSFDSIKRLAMDWLQQQSALQYVVDMSDIEKAALPQPLHTMVINGYNRKRSGSILLIPNPGWFDGFEKGTTHGVWNPQDTHIPLVFMGWHIPHGALYRTVHMTDIAPTLANLLHIQAPNGNIGEPIPELIR